MALRISTTYPNGRSKTPEKSRRAFASEQADLFPGLAEQPVIGRANAPDLDVGPELLGAVHAAMRAAKANGISRERIADRMNTALPDLDRPITKRQVDAWMAASKEFHDIPARYLAALCWALDSEAPARVIVEALGFGLVDAREAAAKELGETQIQIARLRRKSGVLTKTLGA